MKYKISKELFEAVFNEELANIEIGIHSVVAYIIDGTEFTEDINDFFFKCIDFMNDNDIEYYLSVSNDIRNDVFEFLDNWLKINKRNC